jgi:hypothetical protein
MSELRDPNWKYNAEKQSYLARNLQGVRELWLVTDCMKIGYLGGNIQCLRMDL